MGLLCLTDVLSWTWGLPSLCPPATPSACSPDLYQSNPCTYWWWRPPQPPTCTWGISVWLRAGAGPWSLSSFITFSLSQSQAAPLYSIGRKCSRLSSPGQRVCPVRSERVISQVFSSSSFNRSCLPPKMKLLSQLSTFLLCSPWRGRTWAIKCSDHYVFCSTGEY